MKTTICAAVPVTLYFALTKNEVKTRVIHYPRTANYEFKGVHTRLKSLRNFIRHEFGPDKEFYYTQLYPDKDKLNIDHSIRIHDVDMVAVKLPIKISLIGRQILVIKPTTTSHSIWLKKQRVTA